jgi:hypothetical protein
MAELIDKGESHLLRHDHPGNQGGQGTCAGGSEDRHFAGRFHRSRGKVWLEVGRMDSRRVSWFAAAE